MYKKRTLYVDEKDVTRTLLELQDQPAWPWFVDNGSVGNCGWANAPTCWYVRVTSTKKTFNRIKAKLRMKGVKLIDPKSIS